MQVTKTRQNVGKHPQDRENKKNKQSRSIAEHDRKIINLITVYYISKYKYLIIVMIIINNLITHALIGVK